MGRRREQGEIEKAREDDEDDEGDEETELWTKKKGTRCSAGRARARPLSLLAAAVAAIAALSSPCLGLKSKPKPKPKLKSHRRLHTGPLVPSPLLPLGRHGSSSSTTTRTTSNASISRIRVRSSQARTKRFRILGRSPRGAECWRAGGSVGDPCVSLLLPLFPRPRSSSSSPQASHELSFHEGDWKDLGHFPAMTATATATAMTATSTWNLMASRGGGGGGRTVLITGVSKGLGKALALELAKRGHSVIGCPLPRQARLPPLPPLFLRRRCRFPSLLNVDVRSNSSVEELARVVMDKKGVPDIIVNNAGTINKNNKIWEVPVEEFDAVIDNVKGIANMLRHFLPPMIQRKRGIIVNTSSGWGRSGAALVRCPYCASKWAVEGLTKSVAKELPDGMAVVALNPGVINTDMLASCFGNSASLYQAPDAWAVKAAAMILNLTGADNGASLTV
ncbi:uncharacterized protein J3R85_020142 [Psidium guajava]|nr:uncharacterized protein J3R85_020142 [Psidium guajava]